MKLATATLLATFSGYIAISYEIIWFRIYSYRMESQADAFGLLLAAYLLGLAIGAFVAGRLSVAIDRTWMVLGVLLFFGNLAAFMTVPMIAFCSVSCPFDEDIDLIIVVAVTALLGTILPLLAAGAVAPDERAGHKFSFLYAGNIVGSVIGGLVTGFWLFDILELNQIALLLALTGLAVSGFVILLEPARRSLKITGLAVMALLLFYLSPGLYADVYAKLYYGPDYNQTGPLAAVYETSSGVVAVSQSGSLSSGGAYEGRFNVSPLPGKNTNRVTRAFLTAAFHPAPRDLLVVGLGSGSWVQVLANHQAVERITVIEINPAFVQAIAEQPVVASLLKNPKVTIIFDDGRRFLRRTEKRFDVIIQNTIVHWRAHATNLLSREYLGLTKARLKAGGRLFINSTSSAQAHKTLVTVFPYAMRFQNMIIAGNESIVVSGNRFNKLLLRWKIDGRAVIPESFRGQNFYRVLIKPKWNGVPSWETRADIVARTMSEKVITDGNMLTEFDRTESYP
jgi:spermidine synthase